MFERLFDRPTTVAQQWAGPLLEERLRYLSHLAEQGVARHGLQVRAYYLLMVAQCLRLAERPGELISHDEIERQAQPLGPAAWPAQGDRIETPTGVFPPPCDPVASVLRPVTAAPGYATPLRGDDCRFRRLPRP